MQRKTILASLSLLYAFALFWPQQAAAAITITTVPVGNPGNSGDTAVMNDGTTGYGSVGYNYNIGKYDVTVGQYTAFLNAVAATDTYSLYDFGLATDVNVAGIARSGSSGSYSYSVIGSPNKPVTYVSWGDAARFANWLSNGQPTGAEGNGTTETGSYTLNGAFTYIALNAVTRNANATQVLPTENEWYKAAYYDPVAGHYWDYATGTNTTPTSSPPGNIPNTANFLGDTTGYAVTGSQTFDPNQNYLTDVGAYTASASPYGTFDQNGDVWQLNETSLGGESHGLRGGSWLDISTYMPATGRFAMITDFEDRYVGFRVALVPEPSTFVLAVLAALMVGLFRGVS